MDYSSNISFARDIIPTIPNEGIQITPQTIENLKAITNPQQAIADRQSQQVAQAVSGLIADKMQPELANAALREIEDLRLQSEKMLKGNTGSKRIAYTPEQKVQLSNMRAKIQSNIEWGQSITKLNQKAAEDFQQGIRSGVLDQSDAEAFKKILADQEETIKKDGLASLKNPVVEVGFLMEKKAAAKKQTDVDRVMAIGRRDQDKYADYKDDIGYAKAINEVYSMTPAYVANMVGIPYSADTTPEDVAKALNSKWKSEHDKMTRAAVPPTVNVSQMIPQADGTQRIIFSSGTERPVLLNGETVLASASEATYDPTTNTYKTSLRVKREKEDRAGDKEITYEDVVTDDYGVYRNFAVDVKSKNPEPKEVKTNTQKPKPKTEYYIIPGKGKATRADLKAAKWTDAQIDQLTKE